MRILLTDCVTKGSTRISSTVGVAAVHAKELSWGREQTNCGRTTTLFTNEADQFAHR